jgi:hypothetical protein
MKKFDFYATGVMALIIIPLSLWSGSRGWVVHDFWGMTLNLSLVMLVIAISYLILESIRIKSMPLITLLGCLVGLLIIVPSHVFYPATRHIQ